MAELNSIRCMQLPLLGLQVLMPNSAVAEIIGYSEPEPEYKGSEWLDGMIFWRGELIPIISLEKMCKSESVEPGARSRIAVIYNLNKDPDFVYLGIIMQDIPRAYLAEPDKMQEVVVAQNCAYLQCKADIMNDQLMIPDMDAIIGDVKKRVSDFQR